MVPHFRLEIPNSSCGGVAGRILFENRSPQACEFALVSKMNFRVPTIPSRDEIPSQLSRSRRVAAKHVSAGFGVSGVY